MEARAIEADYGGPFTDAHAVTNPDTDQSAAQANRVMEDSAQMTRTSRKMRVAFDTVGSGDPTVASFSSQYGNDSGKYPTLARSGVGLYSVTLAASYTDDLGTVETTSIGDAWAVARQGASGSAADDVHVKVLAITGAVITLRVESPLGTVADAGDDSTAAIRVSVYVEP